MSFDLSTRQNRDRLDCRLYEPSVKTLQKSEFVQVSLRKFHSSVLIGMASEPKAAH
jgi:hypothetical protein